MGVMSSSLCKNSEGAVAPFQIESLENRVDDPVHTGQVDEAHHGTCAAAELYKNPFNDIGGSQLLPKMPRKRKKDQQFPEDRVLSAESWSGIVFAGVKWLRATAERSYLRRCGRSRLPRVRSSQDEECC